MMPMLCWLGATMAAGLLAAQMGVDMAVMQKWEAAKVVRFHVVGVHQGRSSVVFGDYEGKADVTDRVTVDFVWDKKIRKVVGEVTVLDATSELTNLKSDGTNCPPPSLMGAYEHFQYARHTVASDGLITLNGARVYPAANVSQYPGGCGMKPVPGGKEDTMLTVAPGDPSVMAMTLPPGAPISVSADKKTFSMKGADGWVWTYTPTVVR